MTIVDSSVWIDYFNGKITTATDKLDEILGVSEAGLIDLIYMEVLQGFRSQKDFLRAKELFSEIHIYPSLSSPFLLSTIDNYRKLRKKGLENLLTISLPHFVSSKIFLCCIRIKILGRIKNIWD